MENVQNVVYASLSMVAFLLFFVGLWLGIATLLSVVSGWRRLARTYAAIGAIAGDRQGFVSGTVGGGSVRFTRALIVTTAPDGIGLALSRFLRFRSPPLFFPWSAIRDVTRCRGYFGDMVCVRLRDDEARIALAGAAGERVLEAFAGHSRGAF